MAQAGGRVPDSEQRIISALRYSWEVSFCTAWLHAKLPWPTCVHFGAIHVTFCDSVFSQDSMGFRPPPLSLDTTGSVGPAWSPASSACTVRGCCPHRGLCSGIKEEMPPQVACSLSGRNPAWPSAHRRICSRRPGTSPANPSPWLLTLMDRSQMPE